MTVPIAELHDRTGEEIGVSDWFTVDQARIDAFADATLDHQYIHVDPERAAATPFGSTIAHGFLTLSLIPHLTSGIRLVPEGTVMVINYGSEKVRFLNPVKAGSRIRARTRLAGVSDKGAGRHLVRTDVTVEIEGEERPALVAETLMLYVVA